MRRHRLENIKKLTFAVPCLLFSSIILGQTDSVSSGPPAPSMDRTPPDLSLPIDSGLILLLIAGLGYGIYIAAKKINAKSISQ